MSTHEPSATTSIRHTCFFLWVFLCVACLPGCSGCQQGPTEQEEQDAAPLEPFSFRSPTILPGGSPNEYRGVKPGHWITTTQQVTATDDGLEVEVDSRTLDGQLRPLTTELTHYSVINRRAASLAKGQPKEVEAVFYIPNSLSKSTIESIPSLDPRSNIFLNYSIRSRGGGTRVQKDEPIGAQVMDESEFYMGVLSDDPDDYLYLQDLYCIRPPEGADIDRIRRYRLYRICFPTSSGLVALPSHSVYWTSIAYLVWDNFDPNSLSLDQREAMLDWLHWGGQLIVSGPKTLPMLRGSFLNDYLPVDSESQINLTRRDLQPLNETWSLLHPQTSRPQSISLAGDETIVGTRLKIRETGTFISGTGDLVAERRIGRGRIVVTSFGIADRTIRNWGCYDSFFNGCLLRHPAREFKPTPNKLGLDFEWAQTPRSIKDPLLASSLRYLSRDMEPLSNEQISALARPPKLSGGNDTGTLPTNVPQDAEGDLPINPEVAARWSEYGWASTSGAGVAGWNDLSGVSVAARQILKDSSGISPPSASLVGKVLIGYLIVLVPLNWLFFRVLGHVEWAWFAAPVIAVAGAFVVVKVARLDIGFARSRTEIGVLEIQPGYSRAHLTRYSAIYSSLATPYEIEIDGHDAVSQPFYQTRSDRSAKEVVLDRKQNTTLKDLLVESNTTQFVHSEQMLDLNGPLRLNGSKSSGFELINDSQIDLRDVGIVRRTETGRLETAWLADVAKGSTERLTFRAARAGARLPEWNQSPTTLSYTEQARQLLRNLDSNQDKHLSPEELASEPLVLAQLERADVQSTVQIATDDSALSTSDEVDGYLNLRELREACRWARTDFISLGDVFDLVSLGLELKPGDTRLVGWTEQDLKRISIRPTESQVARKTVVLAYLTYHLPPPATPDVNTPIDILEPDDVDGLPLPN